MILIFLYTDNDVRLLHINDKIKFYFTNTKDISKSIDQDDVDVSKDAFLNNFSFVLYKI